MGGEYGTPLGAAAYFGKEAMVSLLLDRGADINVVGGQYGTALCAAVYVGEQKIVSSCWIEEQISIVGLYTYIVIVLYITV